MKRTQTTPRQQLLCHNVSHKVMPYVGGYQSHNDVTAYLNQIFSHNQS